MKQTFRPYIEGEPTPALQRRDQTKHDLRPIEVKFCEKCESQQFIHTLCKAEMTILSIVRGEAIRVQCSRCSRVDEIDQRRLYDLGL